MGDRECQRDEIVGGKKARDMEDTYCEEKGKRMEDIFFQGYIIVGCSRG